MPLTIPDKVNTERYRPRGDDKLLSTMIEEGSYEQKVIQGAPRRLVTI
jgi:hypothetical protein